MFQRFRTKGFTLIELIAVVVVLGVLAALAVPTFSAVKRSSLEQTVTRSAEAVVNEASALASFNGDPIGNAYIDQSLTDLDGSKDADPSDGSAATISITRGGITATASIANDGSITVTTSESQGGGSGNGGAFTPTYAFSTAGGDLGMGSCFYYNASWANGHTNNDIGFSCTSSAFQSAAATLNAGDQVRITMSGGTPLMYTVASTDLTSTSPMWINFTSVVQQQSYDGMLIEF